jgi:hypothetical protein
VDGAGSGSRHAGGAGDSFGFSVAISGDTALVSAHTDSSVSTNQGSAYILQGTVPVELQHFHIE